MAKHQGYAADILNAADELIGKVQASLDAKDTFYRSIGVDPQKVLPALESIMGDKERAELAALMAADAAAVEQETAEEAARLGLGVKHQAGKPNRNRSMI
jgi:hypothetical protein